MSLYLGTNLISGVATPVEGARNIGQIVQSTIPLSDAGLHLLDGSLISGSGSYADFVTYISNLDLSAGYFCTEAEWQTSVTTYGVCDKFVYDSVNNTVRLPKRTSEHGALIKSYSSGTDWYRIYSDGWCEQGGLVASTSSNRAEVQVTFPKSFSSTSYSFFGHSNYPSTLSSATSDTVGNTARSYSVVTDAKTTSYVKIAYVNSNWITEWQACGYTDISDLQQSPIYEYIVIATSTKTDIEVDIDEITTDLNGKADVDLSNCTKPHIVETYVNGTSWYRVYSDGWCEQGGYGETSSAGSNYTINLLKSFINTNYTVNITNYLGTSPSGDYYSLLVSKDQSSFILRVRPSPFDWQACGYIS